MNKNKNSNSNNNKTLINNWSFRININIITIFKKWIFLIKINIITNNYIHNLKIKCQSQILINLMKVLKLKFWHLTNLIIKIAIINLIIKPTNKKIIKINIINHKYNLNNLHHNYKQLLILNCQQRLNININSLN